MYLYKHCSDFFAAFAVRNKFADHSWMWFCPGRDDGERQMDSVGRLPEQEPCALFLGFVGKGGEGSMGGRLWSSYILFLLPTKKHHLHLSFSSISCCLTSPSSSRSWKDAAVVSRRASVVLLIRYSLFLFLWLCSVFLSFSVRFVDINWYFFCGWVFELIKPVKWLINHQKKSSATVLTIN